MGTERCGGMSSPARWVGVGVVVLTALSVSACGGGSGKTSSAVTPTSPAARSGSASSAPADGGGGKATMVTADESEFRIKLSVSKFTAGRYTFVAKNTGHAPHALEIDGPGVSDRKTSTISGGGSTAVTVTLQKGSYEIYCPVDSHKAQGMDLHITVS